MTTLDLTGGSLRLAIAALCAVASVATAHTPPAAADLALRNGAIYTLDGGHDPYYIEITPSFSADQPSNIPNSYIVVSGKTRGGTSYHNRFVLVPQRLYIEKSAGGRTEILLRRDGDKVSVVELR